MRKCARAVIPSMFVLHLVIFFAMCIYSISSGGFVLCFMFLFCKNIFLIFVSHFIHYFRDAIGRRKYYVAVRIASLFFLDNFQNVHWVLFTAYTISSMNGVCCYFYLIGFTTLLSLLKRMLGAGWGIKRSTRRQTQIAFWDMYRRKDKLTPALTSNLLSNFLFFTLHVRQALSLCIYVRTLYIHVLCLHVVDSMRFDCKQMRSNNSVFVSI